MDWVSPHHFKTIKYTVILMSMDKAMNKFIYEIYQNECIWLYQPENILVVEISEL